MPIKEAGIALTDGIQLARSSQHDTWRKTAGSLQRKNKGTTMSDQQLTDPGEASRPAGEKPPVRIAAWTSIRDKLILLAAWLAQLVIPWLPRAGVQALAKILGLVVFFCLPRRRLRIGLANLEVAFGDSLSARAKRRVIRESVCNMARVVLDLFWFSRDRDGRIKKYVDFEAGFDEAFVRLPFIGVTAHFGNWEMLSQAMGVRGYPGAMAYAPMHVRAAEQVLSRLRSGTTQQFIPRTSAGRALWRALREGRSPGLLLDQNGNADSGEFVQFFGLPVPAPSVAARLASRSGAPIVPLFCVPAPRGRYLVYARPSFHGPGASGDQIAEDAVVNQWIMHQFEAEIRRRPDLWLWMFRRWKNIPFGAACADKYPFYANTVVIPQEGGRARVSAIAGVRS